MAAEDLSGCVVGDGDVVFVDEDEDWGVGVAGSDAEVVQSCGSSEGEFAVAVDGVVADPVVGAGAVVARDVPARAVATGNPATNRLDVRPTELSYDPVALLPPYEAWIGRNRDAAAPLVMPSPEIESRT